MRVCACVCVCVCACRWTKCALWPRPAGSLPHERRGQLRGLELQLRAPIASPRLVAYTLPADAGARESAVALAAARGWVVLPMLREGERQRQEEQERHRSHHRRHDARHGHDALCTSESLTHLIDRVEARESHSECDSWSKDLEWTKETDERRCARQGWYALRQTDRQVVLYFSNNTQNTFALLCSETGLRQ